MNYNCLYCPVGTDRETHEETGENDNFDFCSQYVCDEHCLNRKTQEEQDGSIFGCLHDPVWPPVSDRDQELK